MGRVGTAGAAAPDSLERMSRTSSRDPRYGTPTVRRTALAPGLLAAVVLMAGIALIESEAFLIIRFVAAILALIVGWFALQARHWWWLPVMLAIAVLWNPVYPFPLAGPWWLGAQYLAALAFVLAGVLIKIPVPDAERRRR